MNRELPVGLAGSYGIIRTGAATTAATAAGQPLTLTRGSSWEPGLWLCRASRRTTLIHVPADAVPALS